MHTTEATPSTAATPASPRTPTPTISSAATTRADNVNPEVGWLLLPIKPTR